MYSKAVTLLGIALVCGSAAAFAQEQSKTLTRADVYSTARESKLQGTVVSYTTGSATAPAGAQLELQTATGIVNVHLGNTRLLAANHLSLQTGDSVTVVGETLSVASGTVFAARVIQKGTLAVTLRSPNGVPLALTPRSAGGQKPAAGAL